MLILVASVSLETKEAAIAGATVSGLLCLVTGASKGWRGLVRDT
jgi:hypothetical protein